MRARWAPRAEPIRAAAEEHTAISTFPLRKPCFASRAVETVVPMAELSLLVPRATWAGTPAMRYAGKAISPPPPAMESTSPARNTNGHTIRYCNMIVSSFL